MKTLYQKASHLRSHTWKDIGGLGGILLDLAFFMFLLVMSAIMMAVGAIALLIDYLIYPILALPSLFRGSKKKNLDEVILLDNGTLEIRPPLPPKDADDVEATKLNI